MTNKGNKKDDDFTMCLIENDLNGDTLVTWAYPGVEGHLQSLCIDKFNQHYVEKSSDMIPFIYFKVKNDWVYMNMSPARKDMSEIKASALCIVTKVFNPEKFETLLSVLHEQFQSTGDPTKILEGYLSVYATDKFKNFDMSDFQDDDAMLAVSCVKDIVRMLGMEAVLLWNAVLLKKRILVVSEGSGNQNMMKLLNTVRSLPQLAYHRQDWGILRPLVSSSGEMDSLHIDDLASCGVFIAGTVDPTLATSHSSLFDVIFSLSDHRVTISDDAKSSMRMGSTHRELAQQLVELEENDTTTDKDMLKLMNSKSDKIIKNLNSLVPDGETKLSEEIINDNVGNEVMQVWLARVAIAEGLL